MTFFERLQSETAAQRDGLLRSAIIQDALGGRIERHQYLAFLFEAYHHVRHTVPLLRACAGRLPERLAWLRGAIATYVGEETGHDEWILSDIAACGADPDAVRAGRPKLETELMIAYAYHQIERKQAVGFFGMVHVLEGTSSAIASRAAQAIRAGSGLPAGAFTYLTSHGSLDIEHVKFFEDLMNRIDDGSDQAAVIDCANAMYRLYGDIFRSLPGASRRAA
ncbi:MAG: iron-containing redox enzyme family protein [Burkholderiales bacterium]|nr:iron-containing redox enzyme family protein [Burkholderiales bacterium]